MESIIRFGKYNNQPCYNLLKDRNYSVWIKQKDWFQRDHPDVYKLVQNHLQLKQHLLSKSANFNVVKEIIENPVWSYEFMRIFQGELIPPFDHEPVEIKMLHREKVGYGWIYIFSISGTVDLKLQICLFDPYDPSLHFSLNSFSQRFHTLLQVQKTVLIRPSREWRRVIWIEPYLRGFQLIMSGVEVQELLSNVVSDSRFPRSRLHGSYFFKPVSFKGRASINRLETLKAIHPLTKEVVRFILSLDQKVVEEIRRVLRDESKNSHNEFAVQKIAEFLYRGKHVRFPNKRVCDIFNGKHLIEIKHHRNWREAVAQIHDYAGSIRELYNCSSVNLIILLFGSREITNGEFTFFEPEGIQLHVFEELLTSLNIREEHLLLDLEALNKLPVVSFNRRPLSSEDVPAPIRDIVHKYLESHPLFKDI